MNAAHTKAIGTSLILIVFVVSVTITMVRLDQTHEFIKDRMERRKYQDLSIKVHSLYSEEMDQSLEQSQDADNHFDIRNQSLHAPPAVNAALVETPTEECNCVVDNNGRGPCCVRYYRRPHKMGNIQSLELLPDGVRDLIRITSSDFLTRPQEYDYRDVVLVRDLYSAIISGYLYHLSGRECWLDMYGRPSNFTFRWINNYWGKLDFDKAPAKNDRSICQYLVQESTYDGLLMYTQMSLVWFQDILASHRYSRSWADGKRTLFVCFEDLEKSQKKILDHFFPGGHQFKVREQPEKDEAYGGGHATSRNAKLRRELKELLISIDERFNQGLIADMNRELGCAGH